MVTFLRELLLSPFLIFIVLVAIFGVFSYISVWRMREIAGYGLGLLMGFFVLVILVAAGVKPPTYAEGETVRFTLNILQIICPSIIGLLIGFSFLFMRLINPSGSVQAPRGIKVALMTALWITLLVLMLLTDRTFQWMIGIFALAFITARMFTTVLTGSSTPMFSAQSAGEIPMPPADGTPNTAGVFNRLDQIRNNLQNRNRQ
jgi:hypothetical protein